MNLSRVFAGQTVGIKQTDDRNATYVSGTDLYRSGAPRPMKMGTRSN